MRLDVAVLPALVCNILHIGLAPFFYSIFEKVWKIVKCQTFQRIQHGGGRIGTLQSGIQQAGTEDEFVEVFFVDGG